MKYFKTYIGDFEVKVGYLFSDDYPTIWEIWREVKTKDGKEVMIDDRSLFDALMTKEQFNQLYNEAKDHHREESYELSPI